MDKGSGVTRGDRRRNAQKARLRVLVPAGNAVAGVDLGERKQALVVTGADGQVLARRSAQVSVHGLGAVLDWAAGRARAAVFSGLQWRVSRPGRGGWSAGPCASGGAGRVHRRGLWQSLPVSRH